MAAPALRRIALITGAANVEGMGRCIALRLAKDGLSVAVNDLPSKRQQLDDVVSEINSTLASGQQAIAVPGDVSKEDDVKAMVASVADQLGGLDVMVANAGIHRFGLLTDPTTMEKWDQVMSVNLRGLMLSYKYAAMQMIQQGRGGRIIGASSIAGKRGMNGGASAYAASKFGVRGVTQCAALELAKHKITVNAYAPGIINTTMSDPDASIMVDLKPGMTMYDYLGLPSHPPSAGPEVIASLVSYLAKPESYFITGQTITIDGGIVFD